MGPEEQQDPLSDCMEAYYRLKAKAEVLARAFKAYRRYDEYTPKANGITEVEQANRKSTAYQQMIMASEQIIPDVPAQAARRV